MMRVWGRFITMMSLRCAREAGRGSCPEPAPCASVTGTVSLDTSWVPALGVATRPWQPGLDTGLDVLCREGTDGATRSPLTGSPAGEAGGDRGIENPR